MEKQDSNPLLKVNQFRVDFPDLSAVNNMRTSRPIESLNLEIHPGEIVAVVGASGSGKSLLADAILGILPQHAAVEGTIYFKGEPLTLKRFKKIRGREIALMPQSVDALDPLMTINKQVGKKSSRKVSQAVLKQLGLEQTVTKQYPFEISGGMKRRALVANTILSDADLIIADEPTPGLDELALNETLFQLKSMVTPEKGMMFITHDIEAALKIVDRIFVFYQGKTVETLTVKQFKEAPETFKHFYTQALYQALPETNFTSVRHLEEFDLKRIRQSEQLEIKQISFAYPKQSCLFEDVDISVNPGEIVGLKGRSGIGKSTLAQIIAGYLPPNSGHVTIGQTEVLTEKIHPVQLIWQHPEMAVNPRFRIRKVLEEVGPIDETLLSLFEIDKRWLSRYPSELSGGELQRVCILRAMMTKPKYLIADEMTTMLDAVTQVNIWRILKQFVTAKDMGVIVISHNENILECVTNRIIYMK